MNPAAKQYAQAACLPEDPCEGDLALHRVQGESVYSVLPMTNPGRTFCLKHAADALLDPELGCYAAGDCLMVPARKWFPFVNCLLDAMLDEGLRVV